MSKEDVDDLWGEIVACERRTWTFEAALFLDKDRARKVKGKFRMRVARVSELQDAQDNAAAHIRKRAKEGDLPNDPNYTVNIVTAYILHAVCLKLNDDAPAFHTPREMMAQFSSDELRVLLNLYNECVRQSGPVETEITDEQLEGIAAILDHSEPNDVIKVLAAYPHEVLAHICHKLAIKNGVLKAEINVLTSTQES